MTDNIFLTPDLARAARAFTKVSTRTIANEAGLTTSEVRNFEKGNRGLDDEKLVALKASLEKYGALFLEEEETVGYGVRRKYPRERFMKLNTWEGEGGHV